MYCKLLSDAIKEKQGEEVVEEKEITIDINIPTFIPEEYIENYEQKIEIYQKISMCRTKTDIENLKKEIEDRFGKIPNEVLNLFQIIQIKEAARKRGIIKIIQTNNIINFEIEEDKFDIDIDSLLKIYGNRLKFSQNSRKMIQLKLNKEEHNKKIEIIKEFLNVNNK